VLVSDSSGGTASQQYTLAISETAINLPPAITSTPVFTASPGRPYTYQVTAADADGTVSQYQLLESPTGMTINSANGAITWNNPTAGNHQVVVGAVDNSGAGAAQGFELIARANSTPNVPTIPLQSVSPGGSYRYDLKATDANGDLLTFALTQSPSGMTVDEFGRIRWQPTAASIGTHPVEVKVTDTFGESVTVSYNLSVVADTVAPKVSLIASNNTVGVGDSVTFTVNAVDNVKVESLGLTVNGTPVLLDAQGQANVKVNNFGNFTAVATALDAAGNAGTATQTVAAIDTSDVSAPTINISLEDDAEISAPVNITGTISDSNLAYYTLSVAPVGGGEFKEVYRGTTAVNNGTVATFDPTVLANGAYTLKFTAFDANGNGSTTERTVNVAGDLKLGNFRLSFTDLTVPVAGIPISVTRTYDSLNANATDDFGYGWRMEFRDTDLKTSLKPDPTFEELGINTVPFQSGTKVFVTLPGGKRETFTFKAQSHHLNQYLGAAGPGAAMYKPAFESQKGSTMTLTVKDANLVRNDYGEYYGVNGQPFNPENPAFGGIYVLTTKEGLVYEIDAKTGDLLTATDANGNKLTFSDAGIVSSTGKSVTFERDAQGRIVSVVDPDGKKVKYEYDTKGDLVAVKDREENPTQFKYEDEDRPHFLTEVIDPLGRSGVKTEYDDSGRLKYMVDTNGEKVELVYDPDNSIQKVKDVFGKETTYVYDSRGNVLTEIDPLGKRIDRTFDADNNVWTETVITTELNAAGNPVEVKSKTEWTYDNRGNKLTEKDALGNVSRWTYNSRGQVLTETDALGNSASYTYDKRGNLSSIKDAAGNIVKYEVNARGDLAAIVAPNGGIMKFEYDEFGNQTKVTDPLGNVTTATFYANGNIKSQTRKVTTPTGEIKELVTTWTYDNEGREKSITDAEGRTTEYKYDERGLRTAVLVEGVTSLQYRYNEKGEWIETIYPDGTPNNNEDNRRVETRFDEAGRKVASINLAGKVTQYKYDDAGRLLQTIYPDSTPNNDEDNPRTIIEYNKAGLVKAQIDERGNRTEYRYDAKGQLIEIIYADDTPNNLSDNPRNTYEYDKAGRRISETDPLNHTTTYVYDEVGLLKETKFHDKTSIKHTYDAFGSHISTTDQANVTTEFRYNKVGQLTGIKNAREDWHEYGYDEMGRLISVKDANQKETKYEYDGEGRLTAIELSTGERSTTTYDKMGRVKNKIDFNRRTITYEYDNQNRLRTKHLPDDSLTYTYTAMGQIETVTNAVGKLSYTYDERGRIETITNTDGVTISYDYDAAGNRTKVITPSGTVTYGYDERNRLKTVGKLDNQNATTNYFYDKVGNLERTERPNGTVENRKYDDLNRLTYLENIGVGEVISKYTYTLDPVGNRKIVEEKDGRSVKYTYDKLYRLEKEEIVDPVNGNRTITYTYDAVGNRLTRDDSLLGLTTYHYDDNHRLDSETTNGVTTNYQYDDNGSLIYRSNGIEQIVYNWSTDGENRLMGATITNSATGMTTNVQYEYDANGARVASIVNGEKVRYLIDSNLPHAQVLEEYGLNGVLQGSYVYGNDLISHKPSSGQEFFYLTDGLGSTRKLTNAQGVESANYHYDAYGQILAQTGIEDSYLFAGEQRDGELGLDYLRARYYDPSRGRFISQDAFLGTPDDPISQHKYLYAHANPVNYTDPSGYFSLDWRAVVAIASVLAAIPIYYAVRSPVLDFFTTASNDDPNAADGVMYTLQQPGAAFWGHTLLKAAGGYWDVAGEDRVYYHDENRFQKEYFEMGSRTAYRHDLLMSTEEEEQYKQNFQLWVYNNAANETTRNNSSYDPPVRNLQVPYDWFGNGCVGVTIKNLPDSVKAKKHLQGQWFPPFMHFKLNWLSHQGIVKKLKTREPGSSS
jgi:RHS repeat-associated protein